MSSVGAVRAGGGKLVISVQGRNVETAVIVSKRQTICVSSQHGCSMACRFCDTGLNSQGSNLPSWAILEQILHAQAWLQRDSLKAKSNIVFMGMGEPLLNYRNVLRAAKLLCASGHKTTISTVGVAPRIKSLARDAPRDLSLALSLHAATQSLREQLVPVAKRWPLDELLEAVRHFEEVTGSGVLMQYILIKGVNDSEQQALQLAELVSTTRCAGINIIPYNPTAAGAKHSYRVPSDSGCKQFRDTLRRAGASNVTIRFSTKLGREWASACGQLGLGARRNILQ